MRKAISNVLVNSRYYNEAKFSTKIILQNCTLFLLNNQASKCMQLYISFIQELKLTELLFNILTASLVYTKCLLKNPAEVFVAIEIQNVAGPIEL